MDLLISALLGLVGLINLAPLVGVSSAARLGAMYGITVAGPDLAILMRHRAVLFGIVGGLVLASVVQTSLRPAAMIAAGVSMAAFVALAWTEGGAGAPLRKVVAVDLVGLAGLAAAATLQLRVAASPG